MFASPILYYCSKVVLHKIRVHIESGGYAFHSFASKSGPFAKSTTYSHFIFEVMYLCNIMLLCCYFISGCIQHMKYTHYKYLSRLWKYINFSKLTFPPFPLQKLIVKSFLKAIKSLPSTFNHLIVLLWSEAIFIYSNDKLPKIMIKSHVI